MIILDHFHHTAVVCILLFGIALLYITLFTNTLIQRQPILALPKNERAKSVSLWAGLIIALGMACTVFGLDVLFFHSR
ncbi:hypothetical protein HDF17_001681 [Granulicella arctica]|uniref:Uncharacterized protein n=1 Tax=Granulicella arctica TaxID=940613 RepID=A0A7Y9PGN3_9BACT|nr:hypothetical protein [Granulicella arctica]